MWILDTGGISALICVLFSQGSKGLAGLRVGDVRAFLSLQARSSVFFHGWVKPIVLGFFSSKTICTELHKCFILTNIGTVKTDQIKYSDSWFDLSIAELDL